jgi:foldase protein PrsA
MKKSVRELRHILASTNSRRTLVAALVAVLSLSLLAAGCQAEAPKTMTAPDTIKAPAVAPTEKAAEAVKAPEVKPAEKAAEKPSEKPAAEAAPAAANLPQGVVARVNGKDITRAELVDALLKAGGEQTLEGLIRREVIHQAVANVQVTDAEVDEAIKAVYARAPLEPNASMEERRKMLLDTLAKRGVTEAEFRESILDELKLDKLAARQAQVTDEEIKQEFDRRHGPKLSLSEIQLANEEDARKVHKELQDGGSFEQLAKTKSVDRRRGQLGGRVPTPQTKGARGDKYGQVAAALAEGAVSEPFQNAPNGNWYIVKLNSVTPESAKFEEAKDRIAEELKSRKQASLKGQVTMELMKKASIERGQLLPAQEK